MSTLLTNLAAYWKLDESSGNASDQVNSNTLTNNNTVTYSAAKIGNGANFVRASSQSLSIANGSQTGLNITGDLSIAGWFKFATLSNLDYSMVSRLTGGNGYRLFNSVSSATPHLSLTVNGNGPSIAAAGITAGTFFHIVASYASGTGVTTFYVNGSSIGTTAGGAAPVSNTASFVLGANAGADFLDGSIDELGVWSRQLTSGEVTTLYSAGNGFTYPLGIITLAETQGSTDVNIFAQAVTLAETQGSTDTNKFKSGWADGAKDASTWTTLKQS